MDRNEIKTWRQGQFIEQPQHRRWTKEQKRQSNEQEKY
jgi:hypothetical protein